MAKTEKSTLAIDRTRLASGEWCHRLQKTIGEGDIHASYSADRIGMSQPVRKPFSWEGKLWVCTSFTCHGETVCAEVYRLTPPAMFDGAPAAYAEKTADSGAARAAAKGFYHGMSVTHAGASFVLCGPPLTFIPGQPGQLSLF